MLVIDVEGDVSAASMVKDSKVYIEIAKFVQAYNTIIKNPNIFLSEVGEPTIDSENETLTWEQFVKIATTCDLGFNPVPTENQLAMYYSYAVQIGSISKEEKVLATVKDVAEAQKKYYNFIDDATEKLEARYTKQHQITENREAEALEAQNNIDKKKLKAAGILCLMGLGVFLCGLGLGGLFFNIPLVTFFGFGNRYVGSVVFIVGGFCLFFFLDRIYVKFKYDYLQYKKDSEKIISKSERTSRDDLIMKDKLDKFREDLKVAKYELNDKDKTYDVENCIDKLKQKNKYYQNLLEDEDAKHRRGLFDDMMKSNIDDMPMKDGRKSLGEQLMDAMFGKNPDDMEHLNNVSDTNFINTNAGFDRNDLENGFNRKPHEHHHHHDHDEHIHDDHHYHDYDDPHDPHYDPLRKSEENRTNQEQIVINQMETEQLMQANGASNGNVDFSYNYNSSTASASKDENSDFNQFDNSTSKDDDLEIVRDEISANSNLSDVETTGYKEMKEILGEDIYSQNESADNDIKNPDSTQTNEQTNEQTSDEIVQLDYFDPDFVNSLGDRTVIEKEAIQALKKEKELQDMAEEMGGREL